MSRLVDVQVVGGGPAALAFAIRAATAGLLVRLADRARPPVDKPCGEGIMPDGVELLRELGIDLDALPCRPFRGIRYLSDDWRADGRFPGRPGLGVRRTELHQALVRRADETGVELLWGARVTGMREEDPNWVAESAAGELPGRWLVGADGLRSRVRRWAGLEGRDASCGGSQNSLRTNSCEPSSEASRPSSGPEYAFRGRKRRMERFGVRRHFEIEPWSDRVEVWWAEDAEAYVTPVDERRVGVAILWDRRRTDGGFDALIPRFPGLSQRLAGAAVVSDDRGCGPLEQCAAGVVRGRVALLGDAAGYVDAITGEGLSLAFHQGKALVAAILAEDLAAYERACRRLARLPDALTRLLLVVERRPWLRRRMVRLFARDPELFDRLLAIHARERPPWSLGLGGLGRLARGLVG